MCSSNYKIADENVELEGQICSMTFSLSLRSDWASMSTHGQFTALLEWQLQGDEFVGSSARYWPGAASRFGPVLDVSDPKAPLDMR